MKSWAVGMTMLVAIAAIGGCKRPSANKPVPETAVPNAAPVASVLLFADLSEAEDSCGCGEIIRAVRDARARGIATTEIDTGKGDPSDLAKRHRVLVSPAVLFLSEDGREVHRYEGESSDVVRGIKADLAKIASRGR